YRVRPARIPQHAGSLVAVRAGRRLRADDPVPANGADGHPGATPATTGGDWKSRRREKNGTCDLLTHTGNVTTTREEDDDNHLTTTARSAVVGRRCCLGPDAAFERRGGTAHRICGADHRHLRPGRQGYGRWLPVLP